MKRYIIGDEFHATMITRFNQIRKEFSNYNDGEISKSYLSLFLLL